MLAFNPTRLAINIPWGYSASEVLNIPYIPDFLIPPQNMTTKLQDEIIEQILDLLALPTTSSRVRTPRELASSQAISSNDKLTHSKALNLQGRHRDASAILLQLAKSTPTLAGVWTNLGYTYSLMERWADGIEACQYAFEVTHERTTSARCMGTCLMSLRHYEEACAAFHRALATNANYGAAWLGLGIALLAIEHETDAYKAFDQIGSLNPNNPWAYEDEQIAIRADQYKRLLLG